MKRKVSIDARGDRAVVASLWSSGASGGLYFLGEWAEGADEPVSDEALGSLVREAFRECRAGVPKPAFRNDPDLKRRSARRLALAGVRSHAAYGKNSRHVSLTWDDATGKIELMPHESDRGGGFSGLADLSFTVQADVDNAELGSAIRRAIAVSKSFGQPQLANPGPNS